MLTNDQVKGNNKRALSMQSARNRADYTYMVLQKLTKSEGEVKASDQIMKLCANRVDVRLFTIIIILFHFYLHELN